MPKKLDTQEIKLTKHHNIYQDITNDQNKLLTSMVRKLLKNIDKNDPIIYEALSNYFDWNLFDLSPIEIKKMIYRMDYSTLQDINILYDSTNFQIWENYKAFQWSLPSKVKNDDFPLVYRLIKKELVNFLKDFYSENLLQKYDHCLLRLVFVNQNIFNSFMEQNKTLCKAVTIWYNKWWTYAKSKKNHPTLDYYDNRRDSFQWWQQGASMKTRWWYLSDLPDS